MRVRMWCERGGEFHGEREDEGRESVRATMRVRITESVRKSMGANVRACEGM